MKHSILTAALTIIVLAVPLFWGTEGAAQTKFQIAIGGINFDEGYDVIQTFDGGYIMAGFTTSFGAGSIDVYLVKTDGNGNLLWSKTFGGTGNDYCYSIQQTSDGGFIIGGLTTSFGAGNEDIYLVKTDVSGNLSWSKTFGGTSADRCYSVQQTSDGGYIIGGLTYSFGAGSSDVYLIKTDGSGNLSWSKTFGGAGNDNGSSAKQTSDGGFIIGGTTYSFGAGNGDIYLVKTDGSGNLSWSKTFGGAGTDESYSVQQTLDGGYIMGGRTNGFGAGNYDVYLVKTDGSGNLSWSKTFGGAGIDNGSSAKQTSDGGYIMGRYTYNYGAGDRDLYLIKTD